MRAHFFRGHRIEIGTLRHRFGGTDMPEQNISKETLELLAVDEALDRLTNIEPQVAELAKLRYVVGLNNAEAAAALGMSPGKADQLWAYARSWLQEELAAYEEH